MCAILLPTAARCVLETSGRGAGGGVVVAVMTQTLEQKIFGSTSWKLAVQSRIDLL